MGENRYFPGQGAAFDAQRQHDHAFGYPSGGPVLTAGHGGRSYAAPEPGWSHPSLGGQSPQPVYAAQAPFHAHEPVNAHAPQASRAVKTGNVLHGLGAVLSVALIVGAGGWMWQLMQRDVAGVPVVRALEGPLRVSPENPGGRQAAHQGLSVNELAAAQEDAPRDTIVLAPAPLDLAAEDTAPARNFETQPQNGAEFEGQPIAVALQQEVDVSRNASGLGIVSPTRRAVSASPRPPARNAVRRDQTRVAAVSPAPDASPVADDLASNVANSVAMGLSNVRDLDVDPASIGPGTRLVQLGAYDDAAAARAAWDQLSRRFSPLLDDRGRVIEAAHSGGSVFYRLRAHGFSDERDARRFCAALVDQQIDCIPVLIR